MIFWLTALALLPIVLGGHGSFEVRDPSPHFDHLNPFPPETSTCCPQIPWFPKKLKSLDEKVFDFDKRNSQVYKRLSVFVDQVEQFEIAQAKINDYIVNTKLSIYANGIKGDKGYLGVGGEEGDAGEPGLKGVEGHTGRTGRRGFPGNFGPPGAKGVKGEKGFKGPEGQPGPIGTYSGPPALSTFAGDRGARGQKGLQGPPGLQGTKGVNGLKGYVGREGPKGPHGSSCCAKKRTDVDTWGEPDWPGSLA
uniref:Uncharacterized protein n=1 Tax=Plectus sambesii TaxID=2011161 RepID=A0A914XNW9_9BILA